MNLAPLRKKHSDGFYVEFLSLEINKLFRYRDVDWFNNDRDYCVYAWRAPNGELYYWGKGRYWDLANHSVKDWERSRPMAHKKDLLAKTITSSWTCVILCWGLTNFESKVLEAKLIKVNSIDRPLTKKGVYKWDNTSLMNKRHELKYEGLCDRYLNGNINWKTIGR